MKGKLKQVKGITLIALVITIIVLLILAGVSIAMLTGQNGILTQANNAKVQQSHGAVREGIALAYNEYQIEINTASNTKLASTETVQVQGKEEKALASYSSFLDFLNSKGYIKEGTTDVLDVEALTGSSQALGNGSGTSDVYMLEEVNDTYVLNYYDEQGNDEELWSVSISGEELENQKSLILGYEGVSQGETIELPYTKKYAVYNNENREVKTANYNFSVDWGDGSVTEGVTNDNIVEEGAHTYSQAGNYQIKITGTFDTISDKYSEDGNTYSSKIERNNWREIIQWGNTGLISIELSSSDIEYLPSPSDSSFENLENIDFSNSELKEIPVDLFKNCPKLKSLYRTFYQCRELREIPERLFDNCQNVTNFNGTFMNCSNLESIPSDLFDNCTNVESFVVTFYNCSSLTGQSIPLWNRVQGSSDYIGTPDGKGCYYGCNGLADYSSIPDYWKQRVPEIEPPQ